MLGHYYDMNAWSFNDMFMELSTHREGSYYSKFTGDTNPCSYHPHIYNDMTLLRPQRQIFEFSFPAGGTFMRTIYLRATTSMAL